MRRVRARSLQVDRLAGFNCANLEQRQKLTDAGPRAVSDFFDDRLGEAGRVRLKTPTPWIRDWVYDTALRKSATLDVIRSQDGLPQRILIVGVAVPKRPGALEAIMAELAKSRHHVDCVALPMKPQGKFANIDEAITAAPAPLASYDWLVITDDDVGLPPGFLDNYIALASAADLSISQPAHRFASYASFAITQRRFRTLVRQTNFVEIGPITVLHARTFSALVPFPASRWCWGLDVVWAEIARREGWRMGIVDGVPIRHLQPVAKSYDKSEAVAEAKAMFADLGIRMSRAELMTSADLLRA